MPQTIVNRETGVSIFLTAGFPVSDRTGSFKVYISFIGTGISVDVDTQVSLQAGTLNRVPQG